MASGFRVAVKVACVEKVLVGLVFPKQEFQRNSGPFSDSGMTHSSDASELIKFGDRGRNAKITPFVSFG